MCFVRLDVRSINLGAFLTAAIQQRLVNDTTAIQQRLVNDTTASAKCADLLKLGNDWNKSEMALFVFIQLEIARLHSVLNALQHLKL